MKGHERKQAAEALVIVHSLGASAAFRKKHSRRGAFPAAQFLPAARCKQASTQQGQAAVSQSEQQINFMWM